MNVFVQRANGFRATDTYIQLHTPTTLLCCHADKQHFTNYTPIHLLTILYHSSDFFRFLQVSSDFFRFLQIRFSLLLVLFTFTALCSHMCNDRSHRAFDMSPEVLQVRALLKLPVRMNTFLPSFHQRVARFAGQKAAPRYLNRLDVMNWSQRFKQMEKK